jgi:hypothetical protein
MTDSIWMHKEFPLDLSTCDGRDTCAFACCSVQRPVAGGSSHSCGLAATSQDAHTRMLLEAGFNSQYLAAQLSPMFQLALDEKGQVVRVGIDEARDRSLRAYVARSAELGLELYIGTAYRKVHAEQLEALGPINHVVVQGPRRCLRAGERPIPSPLERKYWLGQLLQEALYVAELAKEYPNVKGFNFDLEAYAENFMWRNNSSFDDQTFFAAIKRMEEKSGKPLMNEARKADKAQRYDWLAKSRLLEAYFDAQSELVTEIATEFCQRVHAVNPNLKLGIAYYEPNWMHDGWHRGIGTPEMPSTVFSEIEYHHGIGPSSRGLAQRLKDMGIHANYLPGLQPEHFTPRRFAQAAAAGNRWHNGYWMFTSYSLWQPDPSKLHGPYTLLAPASQYIKALAEINRPGASTDNESQKDDGTIVLTGNAFYEGKRSDIKPVVTYSREPDVLFYDDPNRTKLFDAMEWVAPGSLAWYAKADEAVVINIDMTRPVHLDRYRLRIGHALMDHPMVKKGELLIETSMDGKYYYPLNKKIQNLGEIERGILEMNNIGVDMRYLRLTMTAREVQQYGVLTASEVVLWGRELDAK